MLNRSEKIKEMIALAARDEYALCELAERCKPMILRTACAVCGRFITVHDDEYSIALEAFCDAVHRYNGQASPETFFRIVIRNRLIDYMRAGRPSAVSLDAELESGFEPSDETETEKAALAEATKSEIALLSEALGGYGIAFSELPSVSPKHEKTRHECGLAVRFLIENPELCAEMRRKKTLPIREICLYCSIPRKTVERHRKYIVTATEVCLGKYPIISEYLKKYLPPVIVTGEDDERSEPV